MRLASYQSKKWLIFEHELSTFDTRCHFLTLPDGSFSLHSFSDVPISWFMHFREDSAYLLKCLLVAHHVLLVPRAFWVSILFVFGKWVVGCFSPEECLRQITIQLLEVVQNFQLGLIFLKEKLQRILRVQMRLWKRCRSLYWLLWGAVEHFFKGLGDSFIFQIVRS